MSLFPTFPPRLRRKQMSGEWNRWQWSTRNCGMSYMPTIETVLDGRYIQVFLGMGEDWGDRVSICEIFDDESGSDDFVREIDAVSFEGLDREDGVLWTRPRFLGACVQLGARLAEADVADLQNLLQAADCLYGALFELGDEEVAAFDPDQLPVYEAVA